MKHIVHHLSLLLLIILPSMGCISKKNCRFVNCTLEYRSYNLKLVQPNGNAYIADSIQVEYNGNVINTSKFSAYPDSSYLLISDGHKGYIPLHEKSTLQCKVFKNNNVVKNFEFKATKDCCHIKLITNLGKVVVP